MTVGWSRQLTEGTADEGSLPARTQEARKKWKWGINQPFFGYYNGYNVYNPYAPWEYLPTFAPFETPSFVGKYTSTIEHMGNGYSQ